MSIWDDWKRWTGTYHPRDPRLIVPLKSEVTRRPLSSVEKAAASALWSDVTFLPGSWDKRFARNMAIAEEATELQVEWLWRLVYRYRRQVKDKDLVARAMNRQVEET